MSNKLRLPRYTEEEKEARARKQKEESEIEEKRYQAYLSKLNRINGIGVNKK